MQIFEIRIIGGVRRFDKLVDFSNNFKTIETESPTAGLCWSEKRFNQILHKTIRRLGDSNTKDHHEKYRSSVSFGEFFFRGARLATSWCFRFGMHLPRYIRGLVAIKIIFRKSIIVMNKSLPCRAF